MRPCQVGGGDQLYNDPVLELPELQHWLNQPNNGQKLGYPFTAQMADAVGEALSGGAALACGWGEGVWGPGPGLGTRARA